MDTEIWEHIKNNNDYMISSLGRVKSLKFNKNVFLKPINISGYFKVNLSTNGIRCQKPIHLLMADTFLNYTPIKGFNIDHIDNNKTNNNLSNLRIVTIRENASKDRKSTINLVGVCWKKRNKKWVSAIHINKKTIHLGYYLDPIEAKKAYDEALNNFNLKQIV